MVGTAMANEAIKVITGIGHNLLGRLVVFDALEFSWRELTIHPDPSREPVRELIDYVQWCGLGSEPEPDNPGEDAVDPRELAGLLQERSAGKIDFDLIDVRERGEYELVRIEGARLLPLGELTPAAVDQERPVILCCRTDGRARQAKQVLTSAGHRDVRYVRGGVLGWVEDLEPHKPTY